MQQHKPGLIKNVHDFSHQTKQAKMQWLHDQNQSNVDNNLSRVRREANRHFVGGDYPKAGIH